MTDARFGRHLLKDYSFRDGYVNLNHGSFGTCPKVVRDAVYAWHAEIESAPDPFLRVRFSEEIYKVRSRLAALVHADADEIVLVTNATTGVNTVLRSLSFAPGAGILHFSTIYGACGNTAEWLVDHADGQIVTHEVEVTYPITDEALLAAFEDKLKTTRDVKVAVFDHIVSLPGVQVPWRGLVDLCRRYGVLSLVDGAHGIGHVNLDLHDADPDFFVSNCHKWLHCMRSCAILYVPRRNQSMIHSLPTGHGYISNKRRAQMKRDARSSAPAVTSSPRDTTTTTTAPDEAEKGLQAQPSASTITTKPSTKQANGTQAHRTVKSDFITEFEFPGTIDFGPLLAISQALDYRSSIGGEDAIIAYCTDLAQRGGALVAGILGTECMPHAAPICMINVRLP